MLRDLREQMGLTQQEAAKELGLPYNTYRKYEYGHTKPPIEVLCAMADLYGLSVDQIVESVPDKRYIEPDSVEAAAKRWNVGINKVRRWCQDGMIDGAYIEDRWHVPVDAERPSDDPAWVTKALDGVLTNAEKENVIASVRAIGKLTNRNIFDFAKKVNEVRRMNRDKEYNESIFYYPDGEHYVRRHYTLRSSTSDPDLSMKSLKLNDYFDSEDMMFMIGPVFSGRDFLDEIGVKVVSDGAVCYTVCYPPIVKDVDKEERVVIDHAAELGMTLTPVKAVIDEKRLMELEMSGRLNLGGRTKPMMVLTEDVSKPGNISSTTAFMTDILSAYRGEGRFVITDNYLFSRNNLDTNDIVSILRSTGCSVVIHIGDEGKRERNLFSCVQSELVSVGVRLVSVSLNDFHDRFWINFDTKEGYVFGTSLNGMSGKFFFYDALDERDCEGILSYLCEKIGALFTTELKEITRQSEVDNGVHHKRTWRMISDHGGVEAARRMVINRTSGYDLLEDNGRLDLSTERLIVRDEYTILFDDTIVAKARKRLEESDQSAESFPSV